MHRLPRFMVRLGYEVETFYLFMAGKHPAQQERKVLV